MPTEILRDDFAKAAMQGMLSAGFSGQIDYLAETSYRYADAMLAARGVQNLDNSKGHAVPAVVKSLMNSAYVARRAK